MQTTITNILSEQPDITDGGFPGMWISGYRTFMRILELTTSAHRLDDLLCLNTLLINTTVSER